MPVISERELLDTMAEFLWVFFRVGGFLMVAPMFGARYVPARVRILVAFALSLALFPVLQVDAQVTLFSIAGFVVAIQQVLIGLACGFIMQLAFDAVVIGIQTVSMSMGLGFAVLVDNQSGIQVPTLSQQYLLLAILLFNAMNGHLMVIELMVESFALVPPGDGILAGEDFWRVMEWGTTMFAGAVKIALPAATAVLIVNVSVGVISRAAPTLNLFAIGLPMTILSGFVVLFLTLPSLTDSIRYLVRESARSVFALLGG